MALPIPVCGECGGNCDPECGRHPLGCLYGGITYCEWAHVAVEKTRIYGEQVETYHVVPGPAPSCELQHPDVSVTIARNSLRAMDVGVRLRR